MEHLSSVTAPGFSPRVPLPPLLLSLPPLPPSPLPTHTHTPQFYLDLVGVVGLVKGVLLPLIISRIAEVTLGSESDQPGRHALAFQFLVIWIQVMMGVQRRDRRKRLHPLIPKEQAERWVSLAIFFLVCAGESPETCLRREQAEGCPAGQSSRRDWCTGTSPL